MSINNLNTYQKPLFSLASMCIDRINHGPLKMESAPPAKKKECKRAKGRAALTKYRCREGELIGIFRVATRERIGQAKVKELFDEAKFNHTKAYKLIDAYKEAKQ